LNKYPTLSGIAGFVTFIGWLSVFVGALVVVIGLISLSSLPSGVGFMIVLPLAAGGQLVLMGFLLAVAGGVIHVLIDIEANTRGATASSEAASGAGQVSENNQPSFKQGEDPRITHLRLSAARVDGLEFDAFGNPIFQDTGAGGPWTHRSEELGAQSAQNFIGTLIIWYDPIAARFSGFKTSTRGRIASVPDRGVVSDDRECLAASVSNRARSTGSLSARCCCLAQFANGYLPLQRPALVREHQARRLCLRTRGEAERR
jgi:hypothetical protein